MQVEFVKGSGWGFCSVIHEFLHAIGVNHEQKRPDGRAPLFLTSIVEAQKGARPTVVNMNARQGLGMKFLIPDRVPAGL